METPLVRRKGPRKADAGDPDAGDENENPHGKEGDTFRGFAHGLTRVYGEGLLFQTLPEGVKAPVAGARETLKQRTGKGGDGAPYISVRERFGRKTKQR